jgi:DNA ligase (NAD+)
MQTMKPTLAGVHHLEPMLSLNSTYDPQAVAAWARHVNCRVFAEPKLDGVAASVRYVDGKLESVATRGDGVTGRDITDRCQRLVDNIVRARGVIEVRGEIVFPMRVWKGNWTRADARNRVAHLTTCNNSHLMALEGAAFVACDVVGDAEEIPFVFNEADSWIHPCDGIVLKCANRSDRARLGATKRAPRWALAYKGEVDELRGLDALRDIQLPNVRL